MSKNGFFDGQINQKSILDHKGDVQLLVSMAGCIKWPAEASKGVKRRIIDFLWTQQFVKSVQSPAIGSQRGGEAHAK